MIRRLIGALVRAQIERDAIEELLVIGDVGGAEIVVTFALDLRKIFLTALGGIAADVLEIDEVGGGDEESPLVATLPPVATARRRD